MAGVGVGLLMALLSVVLLWWNEGRSVTTARGLAEGEKVSVEANADAVDQGLQGKLVHVSGRTALKTPAADSVFGVTAPDLIKLRRTVEMFQWVEEKEEATRTKVGGGQETVTEYRYVKKWDERFRPASDFRHPEGHENPRPAQQTASFQAEGVSVGAYRLPDFLLDQWQDFKSHPLPEPKALPEGLRDRAMMQGEWLVLSQTPQNPIVGDLRVQFESIRTGDASVLARQVQDTFENWVTSQGTEIARIAAGVQSKEAMFAAAKAENTVLAWLLRAGGFLLMFLGMLALFSPLKVLADVIPLAGRIMGVGTGIVAFFLSVAGSLTVIAMAWIWYRPVLGIVLLVLAVAGLVMLRKAFKAKAA